MDLIKKIAGAGLVPVVVIEDSADAVDTAEALLDGGIDFMEITFRTDAAADAIKLVAESCPKMCVGAGTVVNLQLCKKAVECGAKFIVTPGYDDEITGWCIDNGIAVLPGCVTPGEIMAAMKRGIEVVKFFPANAFGGLKAMKALSGPFVNIRFMPTGGINADNCAETIAAPFIHAIGGSWICSRSDIAAHNFEKITKLCKEARSIMLDYESDGSCVKSGKLAMAVTDYEKKGYAMIPDTAEYKNENMISVSMKNGGEEIRIVQK